MDSNHLNTISNLGYKNLEIIDVEKVGDWLFIILENNQKILTNGKEVYDVSEYDHLKDIFVIQGRIYASFVKNFYVCLIDIVTGEVMFSDSNAYYINMRDERILYVIKNVGNNTLYDLVTKKYLSVPEDYEFEKALGYHLYVFRENNHNKKFYELKRCVVNADGETLMSQIEGYIYLIDNYLVIKKSAELSIFELKDGKPTPVKFLEKGNEIIANPDIYKEYILIVEKGVIKLIKPSLEIVKEFKIENLDEIIDMEWVGDTLKLALPYTEDGKKINKQMHINFKTGKIISHVRIDGYPYWTPTTYVGRDIASFSSEEGTDFHFYDGDSNTFLSINAKYYDALGNNEQIFFIVSSKDDKNYLLNSETKVLQEVPYSSVCFHPTYPYGFAVKKGTDTIDFIDKDFNILVSNINYKEYELNLELGGFGYFIVNGYLRLNVPFEDEYGRSRNRCVLIAPDGEVLIDSVTSKCYPLGDFIQIINGKKSEFLDTKTGKKGVLSIKAPINDDGTIDFSKLGNIASIFAISNESKNIEDTLKRERKFEFLNTEEDC